MITYIEIPTITSSVMPLIYCSSSVTCCYCQCKCHFTTNPKDNNRYGYCIPCLVRNFDEHPWVSALEVFCKEHPEIVLEMEL